MCFTTAKSRDTEKYEVKSSVSSFCSYFDERYTDGSFCDVRLDLITDFADELVRDHKHKDFGSFNSLRDVWDSDLVRQQNRRTESRQMAASITDVFSFFLLLLSSIL